MKHPLLIMLLLVNSLAVAQDEFPEKLYTHLNSPVKNIKKNLLRNPAFSRPNKYKDGQDSLRMVTSARSGEFDVTFFIVDDTCRYLAVVDHRIPQAELLTRLSQKHVTVQEEDFPYMYQEYSNESQEVVAIFEDKSMHIGYIVINFRNRKQQTIYIIYSLWNQRSFGEF